MSVTLCGSGALKGKSQIIDALREARDDIEHDPMIPEQTRAQVLAAIDRQIAVFGPGTAPVLQ